ncbi:MAG: gluconate 5-dehydrogenase [Anaerospora sp.]|nr:gluconate 5-dehydrogenase [Anaerospora sp.]
MNVLDEFLLKGKIALVTGASYGIGFAIASAYANAGATIVFNDIRQDLVEQGIAAYKEAGIAAHGYVFDVTDEDQVNTAIARITEEVGIIDILVNNAGIIKRIPALEMKASEFRQVIDVDLNAPFIVSKAVAPGMIKKGHGKIINICSMMSELATASAPATSQLLKQLPCGKKAILSITLLLLKPLPAAGVHPRILWGQQFFWPPMLPIS